MAEPLLPRIARGDADAVEQCIDRYGGLIWTLARRLSPTIADAEDAVQEIFIDLWKNAERYRSDVAEESTFVALLARRRLIDRLRKIGRELEAQPLDDAAFEQPAPSRIAPVEMAEDAARARECLKRLRRDEREVLQLSIFQGLTQKRIAERIGIPLGTVKTHARRGLVQIKNCMQSATLGPAGGSS